MTNSEKLSTVIALLGFDETIEKEILSEYLNFSKIEILRWLYVNKGGIPEGVTDVPTRYEGIQISSVVAGYGLMGAENETTHNENGVNRQFKYSDMVAYIHAHIIPFAKVV